MTEQPSALDSRFYRVDKFAVPAGARAEFLARVGETHRVLRKQPGFVQDFILEQTSGPGEFNIVTVAEWESEAFVAGAREAVAALLRSTKLDPQELFARLGVRPDLGNYRRVAELSG